MKFSLVILCCVFATGFSSSSNNSNDSRQVRHRLEPGFECTLYVKATLFEDGHGEESVCCKLSPETMAAIAATQGNSDSMGMSEMIDVVGVRIESIEENGVISGQSIMRLSEGYIEQGRNANNDGEVLLFVPSSADVEFEELSENDARRSRQRGRNLKKSVGNIRTLVVRVEDGAGTDPTVNKAQLRDDIFTDSVSLKTHYAKCSNNKINIQEKGIVDVKINVVAQYDSVTKKGNESLLEKAAKTAATNAYGNNGDLSLNYDLVMFSLPPGTGRWVAYAYINGRDSFYNNDWISKVSAQMHEIGHNLGLGHSGQDISQYGDQTGMMGFSYFSDDGPMMCFNAAKNFQLGWFDNQKATYNPMDNLDFHLKNGVKTFTLNGVNDAKNGQPNKLITLRLQESGSGDYYVGYNRATGMNSGTIEAKNQVVIFKKETGGPDDYGKSLRVADLSSNQSVDFENWNGSIYDVTIRVVGEIGENIADAKIEVSVSGFYPTQSPTLSCGGDNRFHIELGIDPFGGETSWELKETDSGNLVAKASSDKYKGKMEYVEPYDTDGSAHYCLKEKKCYTFQIKDSHGDGICCAYSVDGYYRGILEGVEIFSGGKFKTIDEQQFCTPGAVPITSCVNSDKLAYKNDPAKNCKWVGKRRKKAKKKCKKRWQGIKIWDWCPKTCGKKAGLGKCAFLKN